MHSMVAVIQFDLYRTASQHGVKVILTGEGADEYLAGYPSYFRSYWCTLMRMGRVREAWNEIGAYCAGQAGRPWPFFWGSLRHLGQGELHRVRAYREIVSWKHRRKLRKDPWFIQELAGYLRRKEPEYLEPSLDGELKRSVARAPLPLYLRIADRNSMAHSVEARVPFLDHRLVSLAFQLPARWKMRGPWNKYLLREAMRGRIPESVRSRVEKWGFPVPDRQWFASDLNEQVQDLLGSQQMCERGIYNLDRIRKDYELHRKGLIDISPKLFDVTPV